MPIPSDAVLIRQGAEARVYKLPFFERTAIAKQRFPKSYRHPQLDRKLTSRRIVQEARLLAKCTRCQIPVPTLFHIDTENAIIYMEYVDAETVKDTLCLRSENPAGSANMDNPDGEDLFRKIGILVAKLHSFDIIHGDLTTSNMLVRNNALVLIDLGLGQVSALVEDKAVDLYVLERAFESTHPEIAQGAVRNFPNRQFATILEAYENEYGKKGHPVIEKYKEGAFVALMAVRLRGRKRSMVG